MTSSATSSSASFLKLCMSLAAGGRWATGRRLLFGLSVPEARAAAVNRQLGTRTCLAAEQPPSWQCPHQDHWRDLDEQACEAQLLTILATHGYDTSNEPSAPGHTRSAAW